MLITYFIMTNTVLTLKYAKKEEIKIKLVVPDLKHTSVFIQVIQVMLILSFVLTKILNVKKSHVFMAQGIDKD